MLGRESASPGSCGVGWIWSLLVRWPDEVILVAKSHVLAGTEQLIAQLVGVVMVGAYVLVVSSVTWLVLKYTVGIRVSPEEEIEGLDSGEHGNEAYHGFVMKSAGH